MVFKEFLKFLKEYNIVALSMAFIMGTASNTVVKSLVDNLVMPLAGPLVQNGRWEELVLTLGPINLRIGSFLGDFLQFVILAFVVFLIAKKILKEEVVTKK